MELGQKHKLPLALFTALTAAGFLSCAVSGQQTQKEISLSAASTQQDAVKELPGTFYAVFDPAIQADQQNPLYAQVFSATTIDSLLKMQMQKNRYVFNPAGAELVRRLTIAAANSTDTTFDTLPYGVWESALGEGMDNLVIFYEYSILQHTGADPAILGATLGLSAVSILLGSATNTGWTAGVATGNKTSYILKMQCGIYRVKENRCIFSTTSSAIASKPTGLRKALEIMVEDIVAKISPVLVSGK